MRGRAAGLYHPFTDEILYSALAARDARACYAKLARYYIRTGQFLYH